MYSLVVLGRFEEDLFTALLLNLANCLDINFDSLSGENKAQLQLVFRHLNESVGPDFLRDKVKCPQRLLEAAEEATKFLLEAGNSSSSTQLDVSRTLRSIGLECENAVVVNGVSVDILVKSAGGDFIIEVDDKARFLRGPAADAVDDKIGVTRRLNGLRAFKNGMLEKRRFQVRRVPYYEWTQLPDEGAKEEHMKKLLATLKEAK
jgi:hypothetical protein